jgi:hypothetical protein
MQSSRSRQSWADHLIEEAKRPTQIPANVKPPAAKEAASLSVREQELRKQIQEADDAIARPEEPRGARATVGQDNVGFRRMRDVEEQRAEREAVNRPKTQTELLADQYEAHYKKLKADEKADKDKAEAKRLKGIADEKAAKEAAQRAGEDIVARMNRQEIMGIMKDDLDLIEEVTQLVGRHKGDPLYYPAALAEAKLRRNREKA